MKLYYNISSEIDLIRPFQLRRTNECKSKSKPILFHLLEPNARSTDPHKISKQKEREMAPSARVAEWGQGNIETVHEPKRIQVASAPCKDKVAVLCGNLTTERSSL